MSCCKQLKAWHLIPLLSYLLLRGRCAYCRSAISILYPVVECLTVATGLVAVWRFGISISAAWAVLFSSGLIVLAAIDLRCKILPDTLTLGLLWMGLLASIFDSHVTPSDSILAACLGYVFLWSIANLFRLFRKKEGMGQGDFKMFAMLGAWLGPTMLFNSLLIAVLLALSVSLTQLAMKKIARGTPIAFGPYLALGGWITFIFAPLLSQWFMPIVI